MAGSPRSAALAMSPEKGVTAATALQVRKAIYSHEPLTRADMVLVFEMARKAGRYPCPEWVDLFSEALTDYFVHQNTPRDYIPEDKADWLRAELAKGGGLPSKAEFAMLIDVMTSALGVPPSLSAFALTEIKTAILTGRRDAIAEQDHPAGVVTRSDVEALRAVLYAATTGASGHVTREEAEVLFEIAHATAKGGADRAFDDLFARAVGNYLMAVSLHGLAPSEALHRDQWLDERENVAGFLSRISSRVAGGNWLSLMRSPNEAAEADMAKLEAGDRIARAESEKLTGSEAGWVLAHLTREGKLTSAETRLLQFLGTEASAIPPSLRALVEQAGKVPSRAAG